MNRRGFNRLLNIVQKSAIICSGELLDQVDAGSDTVSLDYPVRMPT